MKAQRDQWQATSSGEICEYITSGSRDWRAYYSDGGPLFIRTQDINQDRLDLSEVAHVSLPDRVEGKRSRVQPGDLLITITGANVGKVALVPVGIPEAYVSQSVGLMRLKDKRIGPYLHYYLQSDRTGRKHVLDMVYGIGRPVLSLKNLREIPVNLPPLDEQQGIVAEIEKQLTRLEAGVASLKRVQAALKRYRASVLKFACEGRLVPTEAELSCRESRTYEPATNLLARILEDRRRNWTGSRKYKEATPAAANLRKIPEGWTWAALETITDALGGFAFESKKFSDSGYQVVKMANIKMGRLDLSQRPSFICDVPPDVVRKYQLRPGDILVTLTGTRKERDYGYVVEVKHQESMLLNQRIARLRPNRHIVPSYLQIAMQSESYRERFFAYETGNVGQGNVGMRAVTAEPIALPPMAEQTRIVAEVERRLSVIEEVETVVAVNLQRATRLRQSILHRAFEGNI